jgi:hypothetical protein
MFTRGYTQVMENMFCLFFTGELLIRFFAFEPWNRPVDRLSDGCNQTW